MKIIVGKTSGFCYGVNRAVEGSINQLNNNEDKNVYCLGEIVHNKQVVSKLEEKGIRFVDNIDEIEDRNSILIIRAHGERKQIYNIAENKGIELIDLTCPQVLRIHKISEEYKDKEYYIFLTGTKNHPEIIGTKSYCGDNCFIISSEDDVNIAIENLQKSKLKNLLLISQTTYSVKRFCNIRNIIKEKISKDINLVIKDTICLATEQRQKETKELSQSVDMMIIIGGKNSSNTKKLFELALENCKNTICIETKEELSKYQYKNIEKIGIMAGASTPQNSIDEVVKFISSI